MSGRNAGCPVDESGDATSIGGVINTEDLPRRLAIEPCPQDRHCGAELRYVGRPIQGFVQRTFGGHLMAQALLASAATIDDEERVLNSLHIYFLRSGTHEHSLHYDVVPIRDGGSFSIRETSIVQDGRELARMSASFCRPSSVAEPSDAVTPTPPNVPPPEELEPLHRRRELHLPADGIKLPTRRNWCTASRPVDIRYIDGTESRCFWFRTAPIADAVQNMHRAILAFASDRSLVPVIAHARGDFDNAHSMRTASIDHAMWFHADVRSGEWYLYVQQSPFHTAMAGLARGEIYCKDGHLVASVTQQGLIIGEHP